MTSASAHEGEGGRAKAGLNLTIYTKSVPNADTGEDVKKSKKFEDVTYGWPLAGSARGRERVVRLQRFLFASSEVLQRTVTVSFVWNFMKQL